MPRYSTEDEQRLPASTPLPLDLVHRFPVRYAIEDGQVVGVEEWREITEAQLQQFFDQVKLHPANNRMFAPGTPKMGLLASWQPSAYAPPPPPPPPQKVVVPVTLAPPPPTKFVVPIPTVIKPTVPPPPPVTPVARLSSIASPPPPKPAPAAPPPPPRTVAPAITAAVSPEQLELEAILGGLSESELIEVLQLIEALTPADIEMLLAVAGDTINFAPVVSPPPRPSPLTIASVYQPTLQTRR